MYDFLAYVELVLEKELQLVLLVVVVVVVLLLLLIWFKANLVLEVVVQVVVFECNL